MYFFLFQDNVESNGQRMGDAPRIMFFQKLLFAFIFIEKEYSVISFSNQFKQVFFIQCTLAWKKNYASNNSAFFYF